MLANVHRGLGGVLGMLVLQSSLERRDLYFNVALKSFLAFVFCYRKGPLSCWQLLYCVHCTVGLENLMMEMNDCDLHDLNLHNCTRALTIYPL